MIAGSRDVRELNAAQDRETVRVPAPACSDCGGSGRVEVGPLGLHERWEWRDCEACRGTGMAP
jgi:DnaJ-class molecular chaperone